ncbi:hypothetical protein PENARI_c014G04055 [Penicillium arizonense]|uniref:UvrD-like helicase ATP-binding domain-containing protein n=1 Tax=Penicillium arizonense TaxID=1835702 RepID=A0A1F5LDH0_PENAI|nr:hypothetical protein PENARI_c014G04055 [Penicillium arizonense]OGE51205.1 hypothetical protein PENARI_c014G04055 [Penicillium arizonense]
MGSVQTPWTSILLQEKPGLHEYNHALLNVDKYYSRLNAAMQSEKVRDQLCLNPDQTHFRLLKSFEILRVKQLPGPVAEEIFKVMVLSFINDNIFSPAQLIQLVGSALPIITKQSSQPQYLRDVVEVLLASQSLLDHLVANEEYSAVLKTWMSSGNNLPVAVLRQVGDNVISMCNVCSADHGTTTISGSWDIAVQLETSLISLEKSHEEEPNRVTIKNLPPLEAMKVLQLDDKKSNSSQLNKDHKKDLQIPDELLAHLHRFDITAPLSVRGITLACEKVQNKIIPELLRSALESFPCRMCLDRLKGSLTPLMVAVQTDMPSGNSKQFDDVQDIFGKRIGLWKVLLSDTALNTARMLAGEDTLPAVVEALKALASGEWAGKNLSRPVGSKKQKKALQVPIMAATVNSTVSILWQIDIGFYDELPWIQQHVIKVWQIVTSDQELEKAIDQLILIQTSYSPRLSALCLTRPMQQFDGTWIPHQFDSVKGSHPKPPDPNPNTDQALIGMSSTVSIHNPPLTSNEPQADLVDSLDKFYNFTEPLLKSLLDGHEDDEFPFELSAQESEVVRHFSTSTLILGRSGTGKTSCLLFKMLAKHMLKESASDEQQARQLLLTRSPYLASKLQTYAKSLIDTQATAASKPPDQDFDPKPTSFFALRRGNFPVICTYEAFLDFMENTLRMADRKDFLHDIASNKTKKNIDRQMDMLRVVDFNIFKIEYWGCLSGLAPASCSPELLFAEIMGVIKGCNIVAKRLKSLRRAEYVSKNAKASPAFASEADRQKVFAAFERYEKQKRQRKEIDELDRVTSLLRSLEENPAIAQQVRRCFEEIYVDEIQDLRCLDVVLLLGCLSDARGIHLAGDTAQCISKDSVFRFPEIKDLFYDHYEVTAKQLNQPLLAKPVQFSLAKNYRSHQGILSFASWVMQLLWNGFPETIDKLEPEIGETGGPKPVIFAGFDASILSAKMIGLVKLNDQVADFGAEQVIIVRDDLAKDKLQTQIGEIALVLTVLESKGMEFDDVLIYDFFGSSELGSSYRCLHMIATSSRAHFDPQKHAALCSELKHLYVAVTRARRQLWFMETQGKSIDPILQALSKSGSIELAELVKQKDPNVAEKVKVLRAGGSVDPERWLKRANHLLNQKNFADALFCYKKAKDVPGIARSQACLHEQEARAYKAAGDYENSTACFEKAITLFLEIGFIDEAASCYEVLGQFGKVAAIWENRGQYVKAAGFYEKGNMFKEASLCYHLCTEYEQAVEVLRRGDQFDELIPYINRNREYLNEATLLRYSRLCNILLKQGRVSANLRLATINMLGTDASKVAFFKEFEMWDQLRGLFYTSGRWFEYYELSLAVGDVSAALNTMLQFGLLPAADKQIAQMMFHYAMAEVFYGRNNLPPPIYERDRILGSVQSTWLEQLGKQWSDLHKFGDEIYDEKASMSTTRLQNGLLKDFFCLYAVTFEKGIFHRANGLLLPMDMISRVGRLLQDFDANIKSSYNCLALVFGIFADPKQDTLSILLDWSPLRHMDSTTHALPEDSSMQDMLNYAKTIVQDRFSAAFALFHDTAMARMKTDLPMPCLNQLWRGHCPKADDCTYDHQKVSDDMICQKFKYLLAVAEVFARATPLYRGKYLKEDFNRLFLGRRRYWVQKIQEELLLISSMGQSALAIAQLRHALYKNPEFMTTAYCLEDLFYHRMHHEWRSYCTLTSFLDKVQQAQTLGPQTAQRFHRQVVRKIEQNMSQSERSMGGTRKSHHPLAAPLAGLKTAERIRIAVERRSSDFPNAVKEFLQCIDKGPASSLTHFHALICVLELAATYILSMSSPDNAIVVPWSWALLHLPTIMLSSGKSHFKERGKRNCTQLLICMVYTLCRVIDTIETATNSPEFSFQGKGPFNTPPVAMRRRYIDFLTTVLLNLQNWPNPPKGLKEMTTLVHKTLRAYLPRNMHIGLVGHETFRQTCIREYDVYHQKDEICVITLDNKETAPLFLRPMVQSNAKFCTLDDILRVSHAMEQPSVQPDQAGETSNVEEYTCYEIDMIVNLQRRWRKVMSVFEINRRSRATREGKLIQRLHDISSNVLPAAGWSALDKIHIRKVLFTDGVRVIRDMEVQLACLQQLNNKWRYQFNNCQSTIKLEELSALRGDILGLEKKLNYVLENWSLRGLEKGLMQLVPHVLGAGARDAQRTLLAVQHDMDMLISLVHAIANNSR